ncbi:MAG: hypothetical protein WC814_00580 [Candidatus Paceibacterota bacterium]|jgi:hypothetical protein
MKKGTIEREEGGAVWPPHAVVARYSDRDERLDEVEASDYRATAHREDAPAPVKCLGFACPASSDICDICHLNPSYIPPKKKLTRPQRPEDGLASIGEAKHYVRLAVPMSRGRRGVVSL